MSEIDNKIKELEERIKTLETNPPLPDHSHTGYDVSRIQFKDIETIINKQVTIDPANLVDGAGETIDVSGVNGATLGDAVLVAAPYSLQGITVTGYVKESNIVSIRIQNESGSTVNLAEGLWRVIVIKKIV